MRLFSYVIPYDDGAAPNPYWGICTLAICKPKIRKVAKIGDWVLGTGSKNAPNQRDLSKYVVYAMEVTNKLTMKEYDEVCKKYYPDKIPKKIDRDIRRRLGDCIYDFSYDPPRQRQGVHGHES